MVIKIKGWYGRLGNNIIQIMNTVKVALLRNDNKVTFPRHKFFSKQEILLEEGEEINNVTSGSFFNPNIDGKNMNDYTLEENHIQLIRNIFKIKNISKISENSLVIHIRSGDVFSSKPHPNYIQPPLVYYKHIIDTNQWDNIVLVAEDRKNPVITELLNQYPKIKYKRDTLENDIKIVMSATNIVSSQGTFIPSLMMLSTNIKNLYLPSYSKITNYLQNKCNVIRYEFDGYIKVGEWKNTEKQRKVMLNFRNISICENTIIPN
jgi:hypothetical protein